MIVVTNAPREYDYYYMKEVGEIHLTNGKRYRILRSEDQYRTENFQIPRYGSGMYVGTTLENFMEKFV